MALSVSCSILPPPAPLAAAPAPRIAPLREPAEATRPDAEVEGVRAVLSSRRTGLAEDEIDALAHRIVAEAKHFEIDLALVMAVIHVESRLNVFAVSPVGALGLMQIMPATGKELAERYGVPWRGQQTLFDPHVNVKLGVAYLKQLSLRYGSVPVALAAYNWGPGHIDRRLRRGSALPKEYPRLVNEALVAARDAGSS